MISPDFRAGWDAAVAELRGFQAVVLHSPQYLADFLASRAPEVTGQAEQQRAKEPFHREMLKESARLADAAERLWHSTGDGGAIAGHIRVLADELALALRIQGMLENWVKNLQAATPPDPETAARERLGKWLAAECRRTWKLWAPDESDFNHEVQLWSISMGENERFNGRAESLADAINAALDAAETAERGKGE